MDSVGTLIIRRQSLHATSNPIYVVRLIAPSRRESPAYRCTGDFALLRALEELLPSAELRLHTLERVRETGEATVPDIALPDYLGEKYGFIGRSRRETRWENTRRAGVEPRLCVVCDQPTTRKDHLTMLNGDVVHYACRPESRDLTDVAARLLIDSEGRGFCHTCLAGLLRIDFDEARKVVGRLRARAGFAVGPGQCSACDKHRITLWAVGHGEPPAGTDDSSPELDQR